MSSSEFRYRGIPVILDTTEVAELDVALLGIPNETMEVIGRNLKTVTYSTSDRVIGQVRVREIAGHDVIFMLASEDGALRIVVGGVRVPDPNDPTEAVLKRLDAVAILRGAFGM